MEHPFVAKAIHSLAGLYQELGYYDEALSLYQKCEALRLSLLGPKHPDLALTLNDIAVLYIRLNQTKQAAAYYEKCRSIRKQALGENHPDYAKSLSIYIKKPPNN